MKTYREFVKENKNGAMLGKLEKSMQRGSLKIDKDLYNPMDFSPEDGKLYLRGALASQIAGREIVVSVKNNKFVNDETGKILKIKF